MPNRIDLVLPCRDEEAALPTVFADIPDGVHVIVVDNGSTDRTREVARALGAHVVAEHTPGYGAAVQAGLAAATAPTVAIMDADGSMRARDLLPMVADVESGRATMSVGRRHPIRAGIWPWHARLGNALVLARLRRRDGVTVHDIAPMRVCRRVELLELGVLDRRFGYPVELLIRAAAAGWTVTEHDIAYLPRAANTRSKVSGSMRGSLAAARDFAKALHDR